MACALVPGQVNDTRVTTGDTFVSVTLPASVTAGNAVVGAVTFGSATATDFTSVTLDGNAGTIVDRVADGGNGQSIGSFFFLNIAGGTGVVRANFTGTPNFRAIGAHEVSGGDTATQPDGNAAQFQAAPGTGTDALTSGTDLVTDGAYIFSATMDSGANSGTHTAGTGFTRDTNGSSADVDFSTEHKIQSGGATQGGTWTLNADSAHLTVMVSLLAAGGGGATPTKQPSSLTTLGAGM